MPTLASYYAELGVKGLPTVHAAFASVKSGLRNLAEATISPIQRVGSAIGGLVSPANLAATAIGALGVAGIGGIFKLAADAESLATQFRVLLGSGTAAAHMIQQINQFAAETPFEQQELGDAAKQLLAYGTSADQVLPTLRRLGDIAALSGARLAELVPIYGKVQAQGRLTAETLESWQARGIPITRELARALGVAESQVRDLVSEGKVGFAEVQAAIVALTSAGGQYANGMAQLAQTTGGLWSTVTGNLKTLLANFGQGLIEAFRLREVLAGLGSWLGSATAGAGELATILAETFSRAWAAVAPVVEAFGSLLGLVLDLGKILWDTFGPLIGLIGGQFLAAIRTVARMITNLVENLRAALRWLGLIKDEVKPVAASARKPATKAAAQPATPAVPTPAATAAAATGATAAATMARVPVFEGLTDLYRRISEATATTEAQRTAAATERTAKAAERTADALERLTARPAATVSGTSPASYSVLAPG